jgi:hypothetical protein
MSDVTQINYQSDFKAKLSLIDSKGSDIGFPEYDWEAEFSTDGARKYVASYIGGVCTNCYNENNTIVIVFDNHGLNVGELNVKFIAELADGTYPDLSQRLVTIDSNMSIELVKGTPSLPSSIEISTMLPYIKGEQGDAMTWEKMSDSEKQEVVDGAVAKIRPEVDESLAKVQTDAENVIQQVKSDTNAAVKQADTDVTNAISELTKKTEDAINGVNANAEKAIDDMNAASEQTINKVNSDTADAIKSVNAQTETAISNLNTSAANTLQEFETSSQEKLEEWEAFSESAKVAEESREERSLSGSFSVDFGTEALTATWFNVEGYKVVITAVQSANCASVTINGTSDAVGLEIAAESVAVVEITRAAEGVSAAVGVKYKLVKE